MLLTGKNVKKEFGIQRVLDINKLEIRDGDRIGLIGRNGAGKSTLLGILGGSIWADEGTVNRNCEIAEIRQNGEAEGEPDGKYISRMNIRDSALKSGGERTRNAIAAAFSKHASLLLADEPTTNLDLKGIMELEKMLAGYRGGVVMVSHDRELLDHTCNLIWELDEGELRVFPGNYTAWLEQRDKEREFQQSEYEKYNIQKKRLEKNINLIKQDAKQMKKAPRKMSSSEWQLYKGDASIRQGHVQNRVKAMESRLTHLEVKYKPEELPDISMKLGESQKIKAKTAVKIENLNVSYNGKIVLNHVSMNLSTGKKIFLTGNNGAGKTTIIRKLIQGDESIFVTAGVKIGYFPQDLSNLDLNKTALENVLLSAERPEHICRAVLLNLYLNKNDLNKKVKVLSGGERVKTAIAKVLVSGCNFLVLDEPTNHMDVYTMEGLEHLLENYNGTALIVSHDRKLAENLADFIYVVEDGTIKEQEFI